MKAIVGPVQEDLSLIGLAKKKVVLCSAFYSRGVLDNLQVDAARIEVAIRIDLTSIDEWILGIIDPVALLRFLNRHQASGASVQLWGGPFAHAKLYCGDRAYLIGSANLTRRGLSGTGNEILWLENEASRRTKIGAAVRNYQKSLAKISLEQLSAYINKYEAVVAEQAKKKRHPETDENRAPRIPDSRPKRFGDYSHFLAWLERRPEAAARVIHERALGQGQLGGHINRNFFGLRQLLLARPSLFNRMLATDPNTYSLASDVSASQAVKEFVLNEASDEANFSVNTWKTYLPVSSGGKPKSGGGTSGNLNRMLPLVARYLSNLKD